MLPISVCRFARRRSCPGVSPQRFDSPWHARLFIGESWHTSPGDHIPAGRLFSCQGARPPLVWNGKAVLLGCFEKFLPLYLFLLGKAVWGGVLKNHLTPPLVPTGKPVLVGCSAGKFLLLLVRNEKTVLVMLFLKVFYYPLTCSY